MVCIRIKKKKVFHSVPTYFLQGCRDSSALGDGSLPTLQVDGIYASSLLVLGVLLRAGYKHTRLHIKQVLKDAAWLKFGPAPPPKCFLLTKIKRKWSILTESVRDQNG